jgi:predicted transcriptional regulator
MKSYFELLDDAEESKVSIEDKEARGVDSDDKYGKMLIVVAEKSKEEIAKFNEIIYAIKGIDKPTDEQKQALKEVQKQRDEIMKLAGAAYEYIIAKAEAEKKTDETNTGNRN